ERYGLLHPRSQENVELAFRQADGVEQMLKRMIAAVATERAGKDQPLGAALEGYAGGDLAIRLVLADRIGLALYLGHGLDQCLRRGVEIADPQFRFHPQGQGVAHATIGRDEAAAVERM